MSITIDWTKPVETTETPPRPVQVLFDKDGVACAGNIEGDVARDIRGCRIFDGEQWVSLRNAAPPKPEPTRHEAWVNLYADGTIGTGVSAYRSVGEADIAVHPFKVRVECRRIAWMSDGSPVAEATTVPGEDKTAEYKADRDWLSQKYQDMIAERDSLKAEIARMRPVVEKAVAIESEPVGPLTLKLCMELGAAVRAYLYPEPKKTAAEAVANVAAMMGPVKSCRTCRFRTNATFDECAFVRRLTVECSLNNFSKWEAKND